MFFKKRISVEEYCRKNLTQLLSKEHEETWEAIRRYCNDDCLNQVDAKLYYSNLRAIFIGLLLIAISKKCFGNPTLNAHIFVSRYLKERGFSEISDMIHENSQAFASDRTDGIAAMTQSFAKRLTASKLQQKTMEQFTAEFYGVLHVYFNDFKSIKLVDQGIKF